MSVRRSFPLFWLLGIVLVIALLVGSGVFSSAPPTPAQRAAAIDASVRCPSCEDLSVANSSAPTAVAVRATVRQLISQGESDAQITAYLEARYGTAIALDPAKSGWSALIWILPVVGIILGAIGVGVVLFRRRDPKDDLEVVGDRQVLLKSLADAEAEYESGDLSEEDYRALIRRDEARLAALDAASVTSEATPVESVATAKGAPGEAGETPHWRQRLGRRANVFLAVAVVCFLGAVVVGTVLFSSNRLPGQTATGSLNLSPSQQISRSLQQAATLESEGQLGQAAQVYQQVLAKQPDNSAALVGLGWLEYVTGSKGKSTSLVADALAKLHKAVLVDPTNYSAHLYLGTALAQSGQPAAAADQLQQFLADSPPASLVSQATDEIRIVFTQAGRPVPALAG